MPRKKDVPATDIPPAAPDDAAPAIANPEMQRPSAEVLYEEELARLSQLEGDAP